MSLGFLKLTVILTNEPDAKKNKQNKNDEENHDDTKGEHFKPERAIVVMRIYTKKINAPG